MVERYWGARHVGGEDYAHLVLEDLGGIRASDLRDELERRGYRTRALTGDPSGALDALREGVPPILLLTGGNPALHYVVLVHADSSHVRIHDPNFGPSRRLSRDELMARWRGSGYLALLAVPAGADEETPTSAARRTPPREAAPTTEATPTTESAPTAGAAAPTEATTPGAPPPPALDSAMTLLRGGAHSRARKVATPLLDHPAAAGAAHRLLATSYFLSGRDLRALDHWNALAEPRVDLVEIRGTRHVRYHVMADRIGIRAREILTSHDLRMARRRLDAVPSLASSRIDYQPLADGTVEVQASVFEASRWPGPLTLGARGLGAFVDRRASVEVGPLFSAGDRWAAAGAWNPAQKLASASMATASRDLPGIVRLSLDWRRERHAGVAAGSVVREERLRAGLRLDEWVLPSVQVGVGGAMERWTDGSTVTGSGPDPGTRLGSAVVSLTWAPVNDLRLSATGERWWGASAAYGRGDLTLSTRAEVGSSSEVVATMGASAASAGAPRMVWPGAGTGEMREALLRGHPLDADGIIAGEGLGRRLLHGTVEYRLFRGLGPLRGGLSLFLDGARVAHGLEGPSPRTYVDPGAGLFLDTGDREVRLDVARGDGRWVLSARVAESR